MRRSCHFSKKGQWFFISAVIASGIFLSISAVFRGYFYVDSSVTADEGFYFSGIKDGIISSIKSDTDCSGKNLDEFIHFASDRMERRGYLLNVTKKSALDCAAGKELENFHLILLQSPRMQVWEGVRPEVGGIERVSSNVAKIKLKSALPYDVSMIATLFDPSDPSTEIKSEKVQFITGQTEKTVNFGTSVAGKEARLANPIILGRGRFVII